MRAHLTFCRLPKQSTILEGMKERVVEFSLPLELDRELEGMCRLLGMREEDYLSRLLADSLLEEEGAGAGDSFS